MKKWITSIALTVLTAALASAQTNQTAQPSSDEFSRKGRWEVYGFGQAVEISNVLESDAQLGGGGFGVGYHAWEHFSINGDFGISAAKFQMSGLFNWSDETRWATLYMANISLDYNVLKTPVTPLISLGAGIGWFSQGVGTTFDQYLGLGVRWDASARTFVKANITAGVWENTNKAHKGWFALGLSVAAGYKF